MLDLRIIHLTRINYVKRTRQKEGRQKETRKDAHGKESGKKGQKGRQDLIA